jgi:hypothetical protein
MFPFESTAIPFGNEPGDEVEYSVTNSSPLSLDEEVETEF